jgi:outer membrane protein
VKKHYLVACIGLMLWAIQACNSNKETPKNTPKVKETSTTTSTTATKETKFAYVNTDTLLLNYEFYKELKKDLETKQRIIQSDLRNRQTTFQTEVQSYQKTVGGMTIEQAKKTEQGLAQKEQELVEYGKSVETAYLKEEQKLNEKLNQNISDYLKKYAEENGYTFIFGYSKANNAVGMIYGQPSLEITKEVSSGLNEEYKKGQKQEKK